MSKSILLPDLGDDASNDKFAAEVFGLANLLMDTINDKWLATFVDKPPEERPTSQALGTALYCTLRMAQLQWAVEDPRRKSLIDGFEAGLCLNDEEWLGNEAIEFFRKNKDMGSA